METPPFQNINLDNQPIVASCSTNQKVMKFSFLNKILREGNPKANPEIPLRPVKFSRTRDRSDQSQQTSAKNILKRTIIRQTSNKFAEKVSENFMMKGKMLSGCKKPLQNQMNSFLASLNDRISRQAERNSQLPSLNAKQDLQTTVIKKVHYQEVIKNLREMRRNREDFLESSPKLNQHYRQKSHFQRKAPSLTISYNIQQNRQSAGILHSKQPKEITYKKGYLAYDEQAKEYLQTYRSNMQKTYDKLQRNKQITANAFMVIDYRSLTPISGRNVDNQIQIASLTKIMTCYLSLLICTKYAIDIFTHSVRVGDKAAETPGTTAQLQNGDNLTIYQLLHGLMLPSGNDASVAVAEAMGKIIQRSRKRQIKKTYYQIFIAQMNLFSKELNLNQTWNNSSGLSINPNYSTPQAIIILTSLAIKNSTFNKIVNTKVFEVEIKNQRYGLNRKVTWKNTNKLLEYGWQGVKTGTTENAGHCLMARKDNLLICVFDCQSNSRRFNQCVKLYDKYQSSTSY